MNNLSERDYQVRLGRAWDEVMGRRGKRRIHDVWRRVKKGEVLEDEEARLGKILEEHQEYEKFWEIADTLEEETVEGVNPFLHVSLHLAVENQIAEENPRQVYRIYQKQLSRGEPKHKIIHQLASAFSEVLLEALKYRKPFDREKYLKKLEGLI